MCSPAPESVSLRRNSLLRQYPEDQMRAKLPRLILMAALFLIAASLTANTEPVREQLTGTWSGGWMPEGGSRDAMTLELRFNENGKLTGRFLTPIAADFTTATFNAKTHELIIEATDATSGKTCKLNGKVEGHDIRGSWTTANSKATVDLVKWTYVPTFRG